MDRRRRTHYVCVTGVHGVMESQSTRRSADIHNEAGLVTPDGMPLVWLERLARRAPRGPRLWARPAARLLRAVGGAAGYRHFFYGGADGVAERSRAAPRALPGTVSRRHLHAAVPAADRRRGRGRRRRINDAEPDIVWVGSEHAQAGTVDGGARRTACAHPVLIGVGAAFDFHAGLKRQAPRWMQRSGLEWLSASPPSRGGCGGDTCVNNPAFLWRVLLQTTHVRTRPLVH